MVDRYGRAISTPSWGDLVYAARRDVGTRTQNEEGAKVFVKLTVWTIRDRPGLAPNVQVVDGLGNVFQSVGPPVSRGGLNGQTLARYLELHTERRGGVGTR